VPSLNFQQRL